MSLETARASEATEDGNNRNDTSMNSRNGVGVGMATFIDTPVIPRKEQGHVDGGCHAGGRSSPEKLTGGAPRPVRKNKLFLPK